MSDLFGPAMSHVATTIQGRASIDVTYRRRLVSASVPASIGKTTFEETDESGFVVTYESRDFLIRKGLLKLDDLPIAPQAGDEIEELQAGELKTYRVLTPRDIPVYEEIIGGLFFRIHTKRVQ